MESVEYDLEEMHGVQTVLLGTFGDVCAKHNYRWFLAFGSLIGAVRVGGMLPWDDAIDVVMPWEDYSAMVSLPQKEWGEGLFLQTWRTDPEYCRYFARLRDSRTTLIVADDADRDINHGIFINIYPLIPLADGEAERASQLRSAKKFMLLTENHPARHSGKLMKFLTSAVIKLTPESHRKTMREKYLKKLTFLGGKETRDCVALAGIRSLKLALPRKWFESSETMEFEGQPRPVPAGWKDWLKLRYGDYERTPVAEVQNEKIKNFITLNTRRPYTEYRGKTYCCR